MIGNQARVEWLDMSLPSFSAARDIFGERAAIQTRLLETAQQAGSEVERLYAESEFRLTVAPPLAAVAIILSAGSGDLWWLVLLAAVAGLLIHAVMLRKHAGRELAEALRSRPRAEDLDQLTPVFSRYERNVKRLVGEFEKADWGKLGTLAKLGPNRLTSPPGD